VINTPLPTPTSRQINPIDSKIKQLQNELQQKVQIFEGKRIGPGNDYGQQTEIKKLVKQFDPLDDSNKIEKNSDDLFSSSPVLFRSNNKLSPNMSQNHPSVFETIPTNNVTNILQNIKTNYGTTTSRFNLRTSHSMPQQTNLIHFSPTLPAPTSFFPKSLDESSTNFDPLAPTNEKKLFPNIPSKSTETNGSNLIDFN